MTELGRILWTPSASRAEASLMAEFLRWLSAERGLTFSDYNALWEWSISDLDGFWSAIWAFFKLESSTPYTGILSEERMPGAVWFPGARLNFAQHMLRQVRDTPKGTALIVQSETFGHKKITWEGLTKQVASVAAQFRAMGVVQGDRVAAILPNTETAVIAFLATASIGAIWSLCSPDMGPIAILDRFRQIKPKLLITQDGYVYAGKIFDRRAANDDIAAALPTLEQRVVVPAIAEPPEGVIVWGDLTRDDIAPDFAQVSFDHPLWVVYSSGTTGDPKPIVQGHGGVLLEGVKHALHLDLSARDRFCWLTSSGWIMWNIQFFALAQGAALALFDGAANHPNLLEVWRFAARERLSYFGAGAAFFEACDKADIRPREELDLGALRSVGSTGSPLSPDGYDWVYEAVNPDIWLAPISGGTDICGAFVGGNPMAPVRAGEMQCRFLGASIYAFDEGGNPVSGQVGELVCTRPLPSMPLYFWGDDDGTRLHESYFDTYPGVWRHGDWIEITKHGGVIIYGRSDATINRKGLRLGSAEIYQAIEMLPEIHDSLVVDLEFLGRGSFMPLFIVLEDGFNLDQALCERINQTIRDRVSPRFIPDEIVRIDAVPRTLSGKKLEVPVKKLLLGHAPDKVIKRDAMANPDSFDALLAYAAQRKARSEKDNGQNG
ncbi:acetoacetate--CoA ligase [Pontibaca salina]|uniref:Acetoacetate--CoA ligase n=1 Tax=Pontibaca salina TaxID=2795731 RepID=A0A934HQV0_9RHOB|nr:acetoacetate--CoA ligase [Pontibaca salina]MBI6630047.1 acetoacetate--CoA ligase [Pontibaca salina]